VDIDEIERPPARLDGSLLLTHRSPPLSTLAATMMRNSQNLYAETLIKTLGRLEGAGTFESGLRIARATLESWGLTPGMFQMADGSGLSRYNLVTAEALVAILEKVYGDDSLRDQFLAALPAAGRDGTLEQRLRGTPAENNVRAKTGSLSNVRSLTGYVWTADGEPLAFSIIANNFGAASRITDETIDAIVTILAGSKVRHQPSR
jgi:D-alanyl-D-alanine carboxypeptidase/D-alanyl-D-alanine-endopeptidase (penicillin-binding protein 4)